MANLIVETSYSQPLDDATHDRLAAQLDPCLAAYGARWLRSYLSTDRLRMVCEFEAPDAEMVRMSYRSAGIDFERVWTAEVYARSA